MSHQRTVGKVILFRLEYDDKPKQIEILEYAKFLGMDPDEDQHLFWIARESLKAPLPANWKPWYCFIINNE
jgi:hypothetical protein